MQLESIAAAIQYRLSPFDHSAILWPSLGDNRSSFEWLLETGFTVWVNVIPASSWDFGTHSIGGQQICSLTRAFTASTCKFNPYKPSSLLWDIGKQCRNRSDTAIHVVWSGSPLFVYSTLHENVNKNEKTNNSQQPLKQKRICPIDKSGKSHLAWMGLFDEIQ